MTVNNLCQWTDLTIGQICPMPPYCIYFTPAVWSHNTEIKVPSDENTEFKGSPFKAWSRSVYSHTCYAYNKDFLFANFYPSGPFTCICQNLSQAFPVLAVANITSGVGPQNNTGHSAHHYRQLMQTLLLSARRI